ncbi:MAG: pilus assembly protein [Pseudomonadota bacterium]
MSLFSTLRDHVLRAVCRFREQQTGAVAVTFAITIPVVLTLTVVTYDYTNAVRLRSMALQALDAALLSTARQLSIGEIETSEIDTTVNDFFKANIIGKNLDAQWVGDVAANYDPSTDLLSGTVEGTSRALFTGIVNPQGVGISVASAVAVDRQLIELALVLDVTGSMDGPKLEALKEAARALIATLLPSDNRGLADAQVRISIVPYADLVNVGTFERDVTGYTSGESCVYERSGAMAFDDTAPVGPIAGFGDDDDGEVNVASIESGDREEKTIINDPRNFRGYVCDYPAIAPLTSDAGSLYDQVDELSAGGWTAGHIGIQWGWYTLSNEFHDVWPHESVGRSYGRRDTRKAMVVMTDGAFNTWYDDDNGDAFRQSETLCRSIKDIGITIYTVGFQTGSAEEAFLRDCASGRANYYDTTTRSALVAAFEAIADNLNSIRLAQ